MAWPWPIKRHCSGILLEGPRNTVLASLALSGVVALIQADLLSSTTQKLYRRQLSQRDAEEEEKEINSMLCRLSYGSRAINKV
jgi:hypothetical protein